MQHPCVAPMSNFRSAKFNIDLSQVSHVCSHSGNEFPDAASNWKKNVDGSLQSPNSIAACGVAYVIVCVTSQPASAHSMSTNPDCKVSAAHQAPLRRHVDCVRQQGLACSQGQGIRVEAHAPGQGCDLICWPLPDAASYSYTVSCMAMLGRGESVRGSTVVRKTGDSIALRQ